MAALFLPMILALAATSAPPSHEGVAAGVHYVEVLTAGASEGDPLPLIVALHGRGDSPENWSKLWQMLPVKARVILPRGPTEVAGGFQWFVPPASWAAPTDAEAKRLAHDLAAVDGSLAAMIQEISKSRHVSGKAIVTGFSQGGVLSYALAVKHGDAILASFPVSAFLPERMAPKDPAAVAPILAFHGEADPRIPIARARESVDRLQKLGVKADLRTYRGASHELSPAMWSDLQSAISSRLGGAK